MSRILLPICDLNSVYLRHTVCSDIDLRATLVFPSRTWDRAGYTVLWDLLRWRWGGFPSRTHSAGAAGAAPCTCFFDCAMGVWKIDGQGDVAPVARPMRHIYYQTLSRGGLPQKVLDMHRPSFGDLLCWCLRRRFFGPWVALVLIFRLLLGVLGLLCRLSLRGLPMFTFWSLYPDTRWCGSVLRVYLHCPQSLTKVAVRRGIATGPAGCA